MSRLDRPSPSGRAAGRHRARPSGPPPFPLRSRGPARRQLLDTDARATRTGRARYPAGGFRRPGRRGHDARHTISEDLEREQVCSGNRCCELLGTGWRSPVPGSGSPATEPAMTGPRRPPRRRHAARGGAALHRDLRRQLRLRPSAHQHHAQAVLLRSEKAAMAKIAAQRIMVRPARWRRPAGPALGHPLDSRPSTCGRRSKKGTDDQELNVAVGHDPQSVWPGAGRRRGVPGPRRQLLRAPQRAQAGRRHHLRHGLQHGEVPGERPAGRPGGIAVANTTDAQPGPRHLLAPERALLHAGPLARARHRGGRCHQGCEPPSGHRVHQDGRRPPTSGPLPRLRSSPGSDARTERGADGDHEAGRRLAVPSRSHPAPLSLEAAALQTYFGGLHAAAQRQAAWWSAMAPGGADAARADGGHRLGTRLPARRGDRLGPAGPPARWSCRPR